MMKRDGFALMHWPEEESPTAYSFVRRPPEPRRRPKVLDPIDAAMAEVLADDDFDDAEDAGAADTRREVFVALDEPAETRREMVLDPGALLSDRFMAIALGLTIGIAMAALVIAIFG